MNENKQCKVPGPENKRRKKHTFCNCSFYFDLREMNEWMNELLQFDRQSYTIPKILCKSILESLDSNLVVHEKYNTFTRGDCFLSIEFVN